MWFGQNILLVRYRMGSVRLDVVQMIFFVLNTALWKTRAMGEKLHMGFVNITKAYDSVDREILWPEVGSS